MVKSNYHEGTLNKQNLCLLIPWEQGANDKHARPEHVIPL